MACLPGKMKEVPQSPHQVLQKKKIIHARYFILFFRVNTIRSVSSFSGGRVKFRHHLLLPEKWPKTVDKSTGKRKQLCTFALPTSDSYIHKESNGKTTFMKWIEIRKCPLMH